jgi:succinyl-CoA synthetase alpha subunit
MGHAGAIVTGNRGSYASKRKALEGAGVMVAETPAQVAQLLAGKIRQGFTFTRAASG